MSEFITIKKTASHNFTLGGKIVFKARGRYGSPPLPPSDLNAPSYAFYTPRPHPDDVLADMAVNIGGTPTVVPDLPQVIIQTKYGYDVDGVTSSRTNGRRSDRRRLALYVTLMLYLSAVWAVAMSAAFQRYRRRQHDVTAESTTRDINDPMARLLTYVFIVLYTGLGPFLCLAFVSSPAVVKQLQMKLLGQQSSIRSSISFPRRGGSDKDRSLYALPVHIPSSSGFGSHVGNGRTTSDSSCPSYAAVGRTYLFEGEVITRETCI